MGKVGAVTVDGREEREGEGYCCGGWIGGWMVVCWPEGKESEGERKRENRGATTAKRGLVVVALCVEEIF